MIENESLTVTLTLENNEDLECAVLNIFEADEKEYIALLPLDENGDNTDGQIYLETELFFTGQRPAVNAGISVSRVGGNAQIKAMKKVASSVKLELAQYRELASFSQFGSDVDADTKARLDHGQVQMEILKQPQYQPIPVEKQVMIIYAAVNHVLDDIEVEQGKEFEHKLFDFMDTQYQQVGKAIRSEGVISDATDAQLKEALELCKKEFLSTNV